MLGHRILFKLYIYHIHASSEHKEAREAGCHILSGHVYGICCILDTIVVTNQQSMLDHDIFNNIYIYKWLVKAPGHNDTRIYGQQDHVEAIRPKHSCVKTRQHEQVSSSRS